VPGNVARLGFASYLVPGVVGIAGGGAVMALRRCRIGKKSG